MTTLPAGARSFQALIESGSTIVREGEPERALEIFQQAAALATDQGQTAEAECMIARCYGALGRHTEAEHTIQQALQRANEFPSVLARAKMQMGILRWLQGQTDSAKGFLQEAQI